MSHDPRVTLTFSLDLLLCSFHGPLELSLLQPRQLFEMLRFSIHVCIVDTRHFLSLSSRSLKSGIGVSLKDQLKKKPLEGSDYGGKFCSDPNFNGLKATSIAPKLSTKSGPTLTNDDWTELLNASIVTQSITSASGSNQGNGVPAPRVLRQNNGRKLKGLSSASSLSSGTHFILDFSLLI
ncbi:hypothetical protein V8G54_023950 [Vigna mungo]|uniref:Uncharacterized protein n=1 Tax=Vigna mungo TaxID=3915 RepID=A0AAQ3RPN9_VIGMU